MIQTLVKNKSQRYKYQTETSKNGCICQISNRKHGFYSRKIRKNTQMHTLVLGCMKKHASTKYVYKSRNDFGAYLSEFYPSVHSYFSRHYVTMRDQECSTLKWDELKKMFFLYHKIYINHRVFNTYIKLC